MNRQKCLMLLAVLGLLGGTAYSLVRMNHNQRLGPPAVKNSPLPNSKVCVQVDLPERVLDYTSEALPLDKIVLDMLPKDTSFGQRLYRASDGFRVQLNVVLMGSDRTSLHKPQLCLRGSGWIIQETLPETISMTRPIPYELPVTRLKVLPEKAEEAADRQGSYVYWFVAEDELTREHWQRMWWMARDLLTTGVLQRWAYVSCIVQYPPGHDEAAMARLRTFLTAAVPEFQLTPKAPAKTLTDAR